MYTNINSKQKKEIQIQIFKFWKLSSNYDKHFEYLK